MSRLSDNDKNFWILTLGSWHDSISFRFSSGQGTEEFQHNHILITAFKKALRIKLPNIIKPFGEEYDSFSKEYGFCLSKMNSESGYDFFRLFFGPQTHDSSTTKSWCKHLPWKMWDCVRHSIYKPDGTHFATEESGPHRWERFYQKKQECPKSIFKLKDYDGEEIEATCYVDEMEWHRGEGWFKWLKFFYKPLIKRSLNISFDKEVGPEKGSWKGGTIGTGITMLDRETPVDAMKRYCELEHCRKGRNYKMEFVS